MGDWPAPGDVALVLNKWGVWNVAICAVRADVSREFAWSFGVTDDDVPLSSVADARPLVVIDPEDAGQVERLTLLHLACYGVREGTKPEWIEKRHMADALREFARPSKPRMPEPDRVGSIVTAGCCHDSARRNWIRGFDGNWWSEERLNYQSPGGDGSKPDDWDSLIDPEVAP
jgi:hypothetical protein